MGRADSSQLSLTFTEAPAPIRTTATLAKSKRRNPPQGPPNPDGPAEQPPRAVLTAARKRRVTQPGEVVYLSMPEVVDRYADVWSKWTIYEWVRRGTIPHVKLPGRRELLFRLDDLEAYEAGDVELEMVKLPRGGRLCRPCHRARPPR